MENLQLWWDGLGPLLKGYWVVAIASSLVFVIMFAASMLGGDADADAGVDGDADGGDSGHDGFGSFFLSFKAVMAFFVGASWTGLSVLHNGGSLAWVFTVSILSGVLLMGLTAFLLHMFVKLQYDSSLKMQSTIGCTGEVYLTVPADSKPGGQVEILVNNSYKTFEAICDDTKPLKPHDRIVVLDVLDDNVLLVGRMDIPIDESDSIDRQLNS